MIILGIDPGSRKAGFALIEKKGKSLSYIASGALNYESEKTFVDRLGLIYDSTLELIKKFNPDEVAIESLVYVKNVTSLAKLSQARGAMIASFMKTHKGKVFEYAPNLVKQTVTGHGHASKEGVDKTLNMIFNLKDYTFKTNDESDALAIALCHSILEGKNKTHTKSRGCSLKSAFKHLE